MLYKVADGTAEEEHYGIPYIPMIMETLQIAEAA